MDPEENKPVAPRRGLGRGRRPPAAQPPQPGQPGQQHLTVASYPTPAEAATASVGTGRGRPVSGNTPPSGSSPEDDTKKGSPPEESDELSDKMKAMQVESEEIMIRPGFGVLGTPIKVHANHFEVRLEKKEMTVVQYHVDIDHVKMKLNRDDKRVILWTCVQNNKNAFPNIFRLAYDGDHILISLDRLQFAGRSESGQAQGKFTTEVRLPRMDRMENFDVKISAASLIHVDLAQTRTTGIAQSERNTTPLHVLDLIFRQRRSFPFDEQMQADWFSYASTVYKIPQRGDAPPALTCGRVIWQGLFGAARVGQNFTPYINFDVSHSGFVRPQPLLDFMIEVLNTHCTPPTHRGGPRFSVRELNVKTELNDTWLGTFNRALKGLKVVMRTQKANGENFDHEYTVNQVVSFNAIKHTFIQRLPDGSERPITVADYFRDRYGPLQYPSLQLLHVGPRNRKCYIPMEKCQLAYNQRIKKLNSNDTSMMIRAAAIDAPTRRNKILELVQKSAFGDDQWLKQFGIRVNPAMKQVDARMLKAPQMIYAGDKKVEVRDGSWNMNRQRFLVPAECQCIGALILDDRDHNMYMSFFGFLLAQCRELGMNVPHSIPSSAVRVLHSTNTSSIEAELKALKEQESCQFVIVTLPQKNATIYNEVKKVAEINLGLMTQCVVKPNVQKCMQKNDRMTATNIALKINMKMGGINTEADAGEMAKRVLYDEPTLVLGIDVTHPSPMEKKMPSISSVVGNLDDTFMNYGASIRVQKHRRESIVAGHLDQQVRDRLIDYNGNVTKMNKEAEAKGGKAVAVQKKSRPTRIIVFRDGVAEGQFQEVLREELGGIKRACKDLDPNYKPKITMIVAQKRHHTRFFPTMQNLSSGRAQNVIPGTVVDRDITNPDQFEFYLCSHFGIQGTSRPIRYHVLRDENQFSADNIQAMAYHLCHLYARCTRTVSLPAPVYYADLACRRARAHIYDKVSDFGSDTMSQRSGTGPDTETQISEDELIRSSTVAEALKMRMYFT